MTTRTRNRVALGLAAGGLTAVLAACGGGDGDGGGSTTPPPAQNGVTKVDADLADFRITLSEKTFEPGVYDFVAKNTGGHDHALEIEGPGGENRSETVEPGASTTLRVTLKSGTYEVYCPVDGHKDQGMKTEITVGGAEAPTNEPPSPGTGY
ncbi:copper-binding protein [Streptomyces solicathayae]|uniref:Copper-binding protein n=1 Tax=Streptomyces solicathayae TaxID=3081768 RepID=A0ABZ0LZ46_9ACTN|nr:copper-binding protein [Streptomyces sp. HUAS YS2]WOX24709.1 copper-binding protein [Streptomyces sp. HUAS YS2]